MLLLIISISLTLFLFNLSFPSTHKHTTCCTAAYKNVNIQNIEQIYFFKNSIGTKFISHWSFENVTALNCFAVEPFIIAQNLFKAVIIKTKSVTIAFFSPPPVLLLVLYISFLFLLWCDFWVCQTQKSRFWVLLRSNGCNFWQLCFQKSC